MAPHAENLVRRHERITHREAAFEPAVMATCSNGGMPYDLRDQPLAIENVILHFGFELRNVRLLRLETQTRLSEGSGVSQGTWSMIQNGLAEGVRLELLARIAASLHLDLVLRPCSHHPECRPASADWSDAPNPWRDQGAGHPQARAGTGLGRANNRLTGRLTGKSAIAFGRKRFPKGDRRWVGLPGRIQCRPCARRAVRPPVRPRGAPSVRATRRQSPS
jgi:transcriptional regulator with XRE-family HTH domain